MNEGYEELEKALATAFINKRDANISSIEPTFLYNDRDQNIKVVDRIRNELRGCDEFIFSVAFITDRGFAMLKQTFIELKEKGIKGKILTTDYKAFTEPKALKEIRKFYPNVEVRMYQTFGDDKDGFHTKGYIFKQNNAEHEIYKAIIGSSNITDRALSTNKEWNAELVSTTNGKVINVLLNEFNSLWNKAIRLDEYLDTYEEIYQKQKKEALSIKHIDLQAAFLTPNYMQVRFITNLKKQIGEGKTKGLLISATGTGKTYASAFGIREINPKRVLFLAHRGQLLIQAINSYKKVMPRKKYSLYTGNTSLAKKIEDVYQFDFKNLSNYDFVFATCELLGKEANLNQFDPESFDFIVIDEVHKAGSPTYKRILNYFRPKYCLGMSATPERSDDTSLVFELFDNNIVDEVRLSDALNENLLCPFHYYGVTDLEWVDDEKYEKKEFGRLFNDERVDYIVEKANEYGYSGNRLKGLIFVSGIEEGQILEQKLKERGYKALFMSGSTHDEQARIDMISLLEKDNISDGNYLEYIITVDIFNEGVDIPSINQVIFLRPTKSSIIFIQQLGRGLRKIENKDYVNVIDFIGNYDNNFMITKAFGGTKESNRKMVVNGGNIPGISTMEFDRIARTRILKSIANANYNSLANIVPEVVALSNRLKDEKRHNGIPTYIDYLDYTDFDPMTILSRTGESNTYYSVLKYAKSKLPSFVKIPSYTNEQVSFISSLGKSIGSGKRVDEPLLLKTIIKGGTFIDFLEKRKQYTESPYTKEKEICVKNVLTGEFTTGTQKVTQFINDDYSLPNNVLKMLENEDFRIDVVSLLDFFIERYKCIYAPKGYKETDFKLNMLYSQREICQMFNYDKYESGQNMGGYSYNQKLNVMPILINYVKDPTLTGTNYEDKFLNRKMLGWESKKNRKITSVDFDHILNRDGKNAKLYLFVRKNIEDKNEKGGKGGSENDYYFLGEVHPIGNPQEIAREVEEKGLMRKYNYVDLVFSLEEEVRSDLYDYFNANLEDKEDENY